MSRSEKAAYGLSVAVASIANAVLIAYLAARLYSAWSMVGGPLHRTYLTVVFIGLTSISLALIITAVLAVRWRKLGLVRFLVPALAALLWLCVGGVASLILGL